jgi:DNA repair protein RecO (recombination protein O)
MLHSTKGIVFHSIKYSETSIIVKIYTELFGIQSYLIKGIRNAKSKIKPGLFQSMTLLDLVVYHKEKQSLQSVKEVQLSCPFKTIPFDIRKSSVALFINELVYKSIREEEANPELFGFLWHSCRELDETEESVSGFHLRFSLQLMQYLGIFPQNNQSDSFPIFNLREGYFQALVPNHPYYLEPEQSRVFSEILEMNTEYRISNTEYRNKMLETILLYYQLHLPGFKGVQSHHILHDVLA